MWLFTNDTKYRQIIYQIEAREEKGWYVLVLSPSDDGGEGNN